MEIPKDIWNNIFSYFHSSYKCPGHYLAIMKNIDFVWLRVSNKNLNNHWPYDYFYNKNNSFATENIARYTSIYLYGNRKDLVKYTGSYYFKIFMNSENSTSTNIARFNHYYDKDKNPAMCAGKNVLRDFIEIFETYKLNTISQGQLVYANNSSINYI